jgi:regulator of replication initiation timing
MSAAEAAALITAIGVAFGAILTSIAAVLNVRNTARANAKKFQENEERLKELEAEVDVLKDENKQILNENVDIKIQNREIKAENAELRALAIANEWKRKASEDKIKLWQEWGLRIGHAMNAMQLEYGKLYTLVVEYQATGRKITAPLPPLPKFDRFDYPAETRDET